MMFALQDLFCEVIKEDVNDQGLAPGFRFHPTDEELITFYLASKVYNSSLVTGTISIIGEVDLNRCEPWDVPEVAKMMGEKEWYFFSLRDRKYPTGLRTNRATRAGYWKATGKDRHVYNNNGVDSRVVVGMRKTLVFYMGRAPRGEKTKWVMHEYRLADGHFSYRHACKEEWVICRLYHKNNSGEKRSYCYNNAYFNVAAAKETATSGAGGGLEEEEEEDNYDDDDEEESSQIITQNPFSIQQEEDDYGDLKSLITPFIQAPERVATTDSIDKKTCPHSHLQSIMNLSQAAIPKLQHNANQLVNYPPWISTNSRPLLFYDNNMDSSPHHIICNPPLIRVHGESWPFII